MQVLTILAVLLLVSPVYAELTKEDIRTIVKEENGVLEKRLKEYIDLKIDGVEKSLNARIDGAEKSLNARIDGVEKNLNDRIDGVEQRIDGVEKNLSDRIGDVWLVVLGLIGLIVTTVAIPQIIIAYRERGQRAMQSQIDQLHEKIESLQNTPS